MQAAAPADPLRPTGRWTGSAPGAAATPPMGWNSWNAFRTDVDEAKVLGAAQALLDTGLARLGYRYVNVDDGWWQKRRASDGRMQVRTALFPSAATGGPDGTSFLPFTTRLHAMGLRAGIYTDIGRNACSQAYDLGSPNLPEGTTAEREVGLDGHVAQDVGLYFGEWGFDYVKVDACGLADFRPGSALVREHGYRALAPEIERSSIQRTDEHAVRARYEALAAALAGTPAGTGGGTGGGRVLSICTWGTANVRAWGHEVGNLWRTSGDIVPAWGSMLHNFDSAARRALYAGPGHWNDPDMLEIGHGDFDAQHPVEARSHFALWAMIDAPLLVGFDLRSAPRSLLDILGNERLVALDQDPGGHQATLAYDSGEAQVLVKTLVAGDSRVQGQGTRKAVALFNRTAQPLQLTLMAAHLKFADGAPITLTDLWTGAQSTFTGDASFTLAPHEVRVFEARGARLLPRGMFLSEIPGDIHVAEDGVRERQPDPLVHRPLDPWSGSRSGGTRPAYAGWGGAQVDSTPFGLDLQVAGQSFATGLGVLANSRLEVRNRAGYTNFHALVGVDDSTTDRLRGVRFELYGDGRRLARTSALRFGDRPLALDADVRGVTVLELVARAEPAGTGPPPVVTWADAALGD